jgi:hypothetical protein
MLTMSALSSDSSGPLVGFELGLELFELGFELGGPLVGRADP